MSKLISNPQACGFRKRVNNTFDECVHKDGPNNCSDSFPTNCPLPDGYTLQQIKESPAEMGRRLFKPKRRNRKDCVHYDPILIHGGCKTEERRPINCDGVNCGHFETKTK